MQQKHLPALLMFFASFILSTAFYSQTKNPEVKRTNHWYFGDKAGIDFSSGTAVADTNGQMSVYAGCSVISDTAGNLLFYTNGEYVWDRNHDTMPNGFGLYGTGTPYQGSVIIPKPKDNNIYYIFHQNGNDAWPPTVWGLHYSEVNITLNNGLGDVTQKNIQLTTNSDTILQYQSTSEQLASVHHANKCDVWVIVHEHHTNNFHAFLVTENGVNPIPVTTVIGNQKQNLNLTPNHPEWPSLYGSRFSTNGGKFASSVFWDAYNYPDLSDTLELFDFDNSTGILSNLILIAHSTIGGYTFSPDNTKLYIYEWYAGQDTTILFGSALLYQYDVTSNDSSTILASKTLIAQFGDRDWDYTDFQNTPNGQIFISINSSTDADTIAIIQNPNASGVACSLDTIGFWLKGNPGYMSLPNFIQSYFGEDSTGCFPTSIDEMKELQDEAKIYPNPFTAYTTINLPDEIKSATLILYDMLGNRVKEIKSQNSITEINRGNLSEGIYILHIKTRNKFLNKKLIITN